MMLDINTEMIRLCFFIAMATPVCIAVPELKILITQKNPPSILLTTIDGESKTVVTLPIDNVERPVAIDFDSTNKVIYWTDVRRNEIRATHINNDFDRVVLKFGADANPEGLAIDIAEQLIFYTEGDAGFLGKVFMDGKNNKRVFNQHINYPRGIALNQDKRHVYWSEWGEYPSIKRVNYDGSKIGTLVGTGVRWPSGLSLDKNDKKMFWCDAGTDTIEWIFLNGTSRTLVYKAHDAHYFDVFLHAGTLYVTDLKKKYNVTTVSTSGERIGFLTTENHGRLERLHVYSYAAVNTGVCPPMTYGADCIDCSHCKTNSTCEAITGYCLGRCEPGYMQGRCDIECPIGTYGNCITTCSGCTGNSCDRSTGACTAGCLPRHFGDKCDTECGPGSYISHVPKTQCRRCGKCVDAATCDVSTGACPAGCQPGWKGTGCIYTDIDNPGTSLAGTVGANVCNTFVLVVVAVKISLGAAV